MGSSTDHSFGPIQPIGSERDRTKIKPFEPIIQPTNWTNQAVPFGPNSSFFFPLPCVASTPTIAWSVVRSATIPPLLPGASSSWQNPRRWEPHPKTLQIPSSCRQHPTSLPRLQSPTPHRRTRETPPLPPQLEVLNFPKSFQF